jgi:hypothetical protein
MVSKRFTVVAFVIVAAAALLAIGVLIGKTTPSDAERESFSATATSSTNSGTVPTTSSVSSSGTTETCPVKEERVAREKNINYEQGSLLVSFKPTVKFSEAQSLITRKGLKLQNNSSQLEFEANHWLTVNVPKGEEFDWICTLKASSEVKNATLNPLFNLAE